MVSLLEAHPRAGYAHGAVQELEKNDRALRIRRLARHSAFQDADDSLRGLTAGFRITANILTFRREALEAVDFLDPSLRFADDWDLGVRLADGGWGNVYATEV